MSTRKPSRDSFRKQKNQNIAEPQNNIAGSQELTMMSAVNGIVNLAEDSKLSESFFCRADKFINHLSERQNITKIQAVLLSLFIEMGAFGRHHTFADIANTLDCNNVQVLQYTSDVNELVRRGMIRKTRDMCGDDGYTVAPALLDSFSNNQPYQRKSYEGADGIRFFQHFYDITHLRFENELSTELMMDEITRLMSENRDLPFVKSLRSILLSEIDLVTIAHLCRHLVLRGVASLPLRHMSFLYDDAHIKCTFEREMDEGTHILIRDGWVENAFDDGFKDKGEFQLTAKARDILLQGYDIRKTDNKGCDVTQSDSIAAKQLFFANDVQCQIESLSELLDDEHYTDICRRLKERGLRQGFACLFYGAPGTGKTESVLQLAKATGRDIMQVNIADVKSMWVGESEKNIKGIFDRYRTVARQSKRTPILLFNEADAVIGKRSERVERSVDKMENSIQNIILQEMETLEGIMIATTNLVQNMDSAFERRFLYKVKFRKPELAQRVKIWQSMMPHLSSDTAGKLASSFDFSGGEIENITRKCDIDGILYGDDYVTEDRIEQYCREEKIVQKGRGRMGFV